jgi:hypothetical protein
VVSKNFKNCAWKLLTLVKKERQKQPENACQHFLRYYNALKCTDIFSVASVMFLRPSQETCLRVPALELSLEVSLKSVSADSLGYFFAYLYILQLTAKGRRKICDSVFIVLGDEDVLIGQINCVHIYLVQLQHPEKNLFFIYFI